jgi:hypothetical protein
VAVVGAGGGLFETPYTTTHAGRDIIITFTTDSAGFRVEYYDPSLVMSGEARSFGLRWQTDMAIQAVTVRVQQPFGARGLTGRPGLTAAGAGEYGLSYYTAALGAAVAGGTVSFDLGYSKTGSVLSATAVANVSGAAATPEGDRAAPAAPAGQPWGLVAVVVAGLVLVGAGTAWYLRFSPAAQRQSGRRRTAGPAWRGSPPPTRAARARSRRSGSAAAATNSAASATAKDEPAAFCPQCGRRYQPGDRFCRQCGAPVRT